MDHELEFLSYTEFRLLPSLCLSLSITRVKCWFIVFSEVFRGTCPGGAWKSIGKENLMQSTSMVISWEYVFRK